jgi:hypothetical protein
MTDGFRDGGKKDGDHKTCPGTGFFGGNTEADFTANLLPLVITELGSIGKNINTPANAIKTGIVNTPVLNVRTGPGKTFPIIDKLKEKQTVTILESNGEWDRIGLSRWANANFIALQ